MPKALWFVDPSSGAARFGIGVGTLVLLTNCVLLSAYLLGCHTLRHVAGGCVDQFSRAPLGGRAYSCVGCLNRRHMLWAWSSLCSVGFSAIERKESRVGHFRDDYPDKRAEFGARNLVARRGWDGTMEIVRAPLPPLPPELERIIEEMK